MCLLLGVGLFALAVGLTRWSETLDFRRLENERGKVL